MRIAFVTEFCDRSRSPGRVFAELAERFAERGHEVVVYARSVAELDLTRLEVEQVRPLALASLPASAGFAWAATRRLRGRRHDVVYSLGAAALSPDAVNVQSVRAAELLARAARTGAARRVAPTWALKLEMWLERRLVRHRSRLVVAPSTGVRDDLVREYGLHPDRVLVVPNGVDAARFPLDSRARHRGEVRELLGLARDAPLILMVAEDFELKGVVLGVETLARLRDAALLVVGGRAEDIEPYRELAYERGAADRLYHLPHTEVMSPYYAAADAFLIASVYEGAPLSALEAAVSGLPVVATLVGGMAELVEDGVTGFLVKPAAEDMAARLRQLLDDDRLARGLGSALRERGLGFTWERAVMATEDAFKVLSAARSARASR